MPSIPLSIGFIYSFLVFSLYYKLCTAKHGQYCGQQSYEEMKANIEKICDAAGVDCSITFDCGDFVAGFVTPLMHRVHKMVPQSREIIFMDSSGGMDRYFLPGSLKNETNNGIKVHASRITIKFQKAICNFQFSVFNFTCNFKRLESIKNHLS